MSSTSTALLREAVQECTGLAGETLYECIQDRFGASDSLRTVKECLLRSLGVHIISIASYGHLLSVQGLTSSRSSTMYISPFLFFLFPGLAIIQPLARSSRVSIRIFRRGRASLRFCIAAGLGACVKQAEAGSTRALEFGDEDHVRSQRRNYNLVWLGRNALLLGLLAQYTGSFAIWARSTFVFNDRLNMYSLIDMKTMEVVVGGTAATINSILLLLINLDWHEESPDTSSIELGLDQQLQESTSDPALQSEEIHTSPARSWYRYFARVDHISRAVYTKISTFIPDTLQTETELAFITQFLCHLCLFHFIRIQSHGDGSMCPPIFQLLETSPPDPTKLMCSAKVHHAIPYPLSVVHVVLGLVSQAHAQWPKKTASANLFLLLHFILIARILLHFTYRVAARQCSSLYRENRPLFVRRLAHVLQWLLGGRTITCLPFFLMFVLAVALRWKAFISVAVEAKKGEQFLLGHDGSWYRVHRALLMFKDPWYDSMYIL